MCTHCQYDGLYSIMQSPVIFVVRGSYCCFSAVNGVQHFEKAASRGCISGGGEKVDWGWVQPWLEAWSSWRVRTSVTLFLLCRMAAAQARALEISVA